MSPQAITPPAEHLCNLASKHLARDPGPARHNYLGLLPPGHVSDAWRFPVVETHFSDSTSEENIPLGAGSFNTVTFLIERPIGWAGEFAPRVRGTFAPLYTTYPMPQVADTRFFATSLLLPAGRSYRYRFLVGAEEFPDPINPQTTETDDGVVWSRFFTDACFEAITFERWERVILDRLTRHILPFNTAEAREFLSRLSAGQRANHPYLHRFDLSIGVVNYLDKLLSREERHQLPAYKTCLALINNILRSRNPYIELRDMPEPMFVELYSQMQSGVVPGWDYQSYSNPAYFLQMLRRHTITGAFSHPRHGGNAGGAGWDYLAEKYRDASDNTLFDWRSAIESPLGSNQHYRG